MNDQLEKYINEHRREFEEDFPEVNQWKTISRKIKKAKISAITPWLRPVAAVFILGLAFFIQKQEKSPQIFREENVQANIIKEIDNHYQQESDILLNRVKLITNHNPDLQNEIMKDYEQIDELIESTRKDFKDKVDNQEVLQTLIDYYEMKLFILKDVLNQIDTSANQINNQPNENKIIL